MTVRSKSERETEKNPPHEMAYKDHIPNIIGFGGEDEDERLEECLGTVCEDE